jgi:hypothetical protein
MIPQEKLGRAKLISELSHAELVDMVSKVSDVYVRLNNWGDKMPWQRYVMS